MINLRCGQCGTTLQIQDELAGKVVQCARCRARLAVPAGTAVASAAPVPPSASRPSEAPTLDYPGQGQPAPDTLSGEQTGGEGRSGAVTRTFLPMSDRRRWDFLAPPEQADELGRLGPYRVLQVLGAGGMGVVFRALDPDLQRPVALKAMLPALAGDPGARERFFREARAAASLKHPHIVSIYQVGQDRDVPFLAMEFLDGESLEARMKRVPRLPVAEVLRIGREIAEGLAAAHDAGVIHRDIKPANIWLEFRSTLRPASSPSPSAPPSSGDSAVGGEGGPERPAPGHVKILDFGLARALGDPTQMTQPGALVGTPAYMAPEQAAGRPVDPRCDLFSLGCVLYRLSTGTRPFHGADTLALLSALALEQPSPPARVNPEVPAELSDLVMRLLAKKPEERPPSARAVAEVLRDIESRATTAPAGAAPAGRSAAPRWPWLVGGGVVCVAAAALFFLLRHPPGENAVPSPPVLAVKAPAPADAPFDDGQAKVHQKAWARYLGVPVVQTNSIGMKLAVIPPGRFLMGSPEDETGRDNDEAQHPVRITQPFLLGVCEVTVGQFRVFVKETDHRTAAEVGNRGALMADVNRKKPTPGINWRTPGFEQTDDCPVTCVNWHDARAFCQWLSKKEGKTYALPTEAQWEHACRAGTTGRFHFGADEGRLAQYAWYEDNARGSTHPVALKKPNRWGLFDMHGNVWEWTLDRWDKDYYLSSPEKDPPGAASGATRTERGGAFNTEVGRCRSAYRDGEDEPHERWNNVGFRVVCILETPPPR
jgi:formylglycine-generating enzyme required for sulfatase activity